MTVKDLRPVKARKRGGNKRQMIGPGYKAKVNQKLKPVITQAAPVQMGTCSNCGYIVTAEAAKLLKQAGAPSVLNCPECGSKIPFY
jgi:DNA-directed RNA polymerase subunit RPC12/RpoP